MEISKDNSSNEKATRVPFIFPHEFFWINKLLVFVVFNVLAHILRAF